MTYILYGYLKENRFGKPTYEDNTENPESMFCFTIEDTKTDTYQTFCLNNIMNKSPKTKNNLNNCNWCYKISYFSDYMTEKLKSYNTLEEIEKDYKYLSQVVARYTVILELVK